MENELTRDKVKGKVIEGTVWIYDQTIDGYVWLTSEENKERIKKIICDTKKSISETINK